MLEKIAKVPGLRDVTSVTSQNPEAGADCESRP
jgi:hypothetical protein